jgi:hypothetical protein
MECRQGATVGAAFSGSFEKIKEKTGGYVMAWLLLKA